MKKLFLVLAVVLLTASSVFAVSIPESEDATAGPGVWLIPVYNNLGSTMDAGDVAIWDIGSSTGDNDNWVTTTSTAGTQLVAGVIFPSDIAAGATGTMAIKGVVPVDYATGNGTGAAASLICTSTTAGSAGHCTDNNAAFGIVTTAVSGGSVNAYIFGR